MAYLEFWIIDPYLSEYSQLNLSNDEESCKSNVGNNSQSMSAFKKFSLNHHRPRLQENNEKWIGFQSALLWNFLIYNLD